MRNEIVEEFAFANLPNHVCALTGRETDEPVVMHRDLSDNWPESILDFRDERLANLVIVDRQARAKYYQKLKSLGVVLSYSGGLDSTTVLHWCASIFGFVECVIFDYGQRHKIEIEIAKEYLENLNSNGVLSWKIKQFHNLGEFALNSLTRLNLNVPEDRTTQEMMSGIPSTFVPGRNIYFITTIAQQAYASGWRHIAMGVNAIDYSGYPDCRPEFIAAMRDALRIGIFNGHDLGVHAPLMFLNKQQIIRLGMALGVDYSKTHSCYNGIVGGCGKCDSCKIRRDAFSSLGMQDPVIPS